MEISRNRIPVYVVDSKEIKNVAGYGGILKLS
jgi:hypothetical protein